MPSLSATIAITGLPARRGFKASTKASAWRSATVASACAGGSGTPGSAACQRKRFDRGAVNARLSDLL